LLGNQGRELPEFVTPPVIGGESGAERKLRRFDEFVWFGRENKRNLRIRERMKKFQ
jgi:hypothetical protein